MKTSSLKPQKYLSSKMHPLPKGAMPNLTLFRNMKVDENCKGIISSNGDDDEIENEDKPVILCSVLKRLVAVLNYYNSLMLNAVDRDNVFWHKKFIEFCDKYYSQKWILEDYMHFVAKHSDLDSTNQIAAILEYKCCSHLKQCGGTSRHYRNRQEEDEDEVHFYIDIMDSLHFNVLHLVDTGLRVNIVWNLKEQETTGLTDEKMLKMNREIQMKRQQTAFPRIDATAKGGKFSLCSTVENDNGAKGGMTKMDSVLKDFQKEVGDDAVVHRLIEFTEEQRYDTETMNEDMAIYAESNQCNVRKAIMAHGDGQRFGAIRRWLRYHRVSGSSFSTGIWWAYWPWYREQTIASIMSQQDVQQWRDIDFGGHSMSSLCVCEHFKNLKEEALGSGLISGKFWGSLFQKAKRYKQSMRCKKMIDKWSEYDLLKFGIPKGFKVSLNHLVALLLYTDSSKYCTALSETFRAIKSGETIEEMNRRNSMYYWTSRYLRELVFCFGEHSSVAKTTFFTGISYEMSIPQFQIGLIGPTSTSVALEVALRFAGEHGMILALKGGDSKCFDTSMFSAYPEEKERIFFGSNHREPVASIILVNSAKSYQVAIGAYSKFDAIFSGKQPAEMSALEMAIIRESIRWIKGGDDAANHNMLDIFILETFYSFIINKKKVNLDLDLLYRVKDKRIINMVMNVLWQNDYQSEKPKHANLMKPFVFTLFRDVHHIEIYANGPSIKVFGKGHNGGHPFNLKSFLRMIKSADIPQTLELILIEGDWVNKAFNVKIQEKYAVEGIVGKKDKVRELAPWSLMLKF